MTDLLQCREYMCSFISFNNSIIYFSIMKVTLHYFVHQTNSEHKHVKFSRSEVRLLQSVFSAEGHRPAEGYSISMRMSSRRALRSSESSSACSSNTESCTFRSSFSIIRTSCRGWGGFLSASQHDKGVKNDTETGKVRFCKCVCYFFT